MMLSLQELANEVQRESLLLEEALKLWRRPISKTQLRQERSVLAKKYERARLDRALEVLDQLARLLSQCAPTREEIPGPLDVGQETAIAKERFEKMVPGIPDKVLLHLTSRYAFYAR